MERASLVPTSAGVVGRKSKAARRTPMSTWTTRPDTAETPAPAAPRERLERLGPEGLADSDVLALLLGGGTKRAPAERIAAQLVEDLGGLRGLERLGVTSLARLPGVGATNAARIVAALELGRRLAARPLVRGRALCSSSDVDASFRPRLARADVEHFLAIAVDVKNRPIRELLIARGGTSACPVAPADVFRALLREAAAGAIFIHNHPSGDPNPSADDVALTERLLRAGELLGVCVLDHVIIGAEGYFSFVDAGLLRSARRFGAPVTPPRPGSVRGRQRRRASERAAVTLVGSTPVGGV
jgi:DNA repair protein RadC